MKIFYEKNLQQNLDIKNIKLEHAEEVLQKNIVMQK